MSDDREGELVTVTNRDYYFMSKVELLKARLEGRCRGVFLLEPVGRNTAAAVVMAALHVQELHGRDPLMLILAADHLITEQLFFAKSVVDAAALACRDKLVTRALARIKLGLQECLYLGNMNALRDWGHARDYMQTQRMLLQQKTSEDFIIATGEQHSVREFVELVVREIDIQVRWEGQDENEKGYDTRTGKCIVAVAPKYYRPAEAENRRCGSAGKSKRSGKCHQQAAW